jgi:type II secretion system (T2SS) protein E
VSSSNDVPRSRDGAPNWAADTDPVGSVTPELALVDPELAPSGQINNEVTMSSMQFGDGATLDAVNPAPMPIDGEQSPPLPLIAPLATAPPAVEMVPPVPAEAVAAVPVADMRDVPLGTLVFRAGLLPEEQLEEALQEGMKTGKRLGEILLERDWVSENDLGRLLAGQKGLPFVELDSATLDPTAPPLLHPEKARLHGALPVGFENGVPVVAVADPSNDLVVENVRRALACEPVLVVAGRDALTRAINHAYGAGTETPEQAPAQEPVPAAPVVEAPVEPLAEPAVAVVEPVAAVAEPAAPVAEPAPLVVEPAPVVAPVVPVVMPPVEPAPVAQEPVAPAAEPVAPLAQPATPEPTQNGDGIWLGQPEEAAPQVVAAVVEAPAANVEFTQLLADPVVPTAPPVAPFEPTAPPVAPVEPVVVSEPVAPVEAPSAEPVAAETPADPTLAPGVDLTWSVLLRLKDGERIEVGSFNGEAEAVEAARGVVAQLSADGSWPFFAGRFIRPDAIVSVDLVELEVTRWLGSQARAAALGPDGTPAT